MSTFTTDPETVARWKAEARDQALARPCSALPGNRRASSLQPTRGGEAAVLNLRIRGTLVLLGMIRVELGYEIADG